MLREGERELEHVLAEHRHPRRAVGLLEAAAGRQRRAAVEHADVVEPEEPALEHVAAGGILAVDPPREVQQQPVNDSLRNSMSTSPVWDSDAVEEERGERVHRRVDVAEVPLVGRHLAARVQVQLGEHQLELALREVGVDHRQRDAVEREVPRRVPRVLPLVRHRDHVVVDHVEPRLVAGAPTGGRAQRMRLALAQPGVEVEVVGLLGPQHAGERLAHHRLGVIVDARRRDRRRRTRRPRPAASRSTRPRRRRARAATPVIDA